MRDSGPPGPQRRLAAKPPHAHDIAATSNSHEVVSGQCVVWIHQRNGWTVVAPNQRRQYNPIPILLNVPPNLHALAQLLYCGMALSDARHAIGQTRAFRDLTSEANYRGALFEIEVAAELVRGG